MIGELAGVGCREMHSCSSLMVCAGLGAGGMTVDEDDTEVAEAEAACIRSVGVLGPVFNTS